MRLTDNHFLYPDNVEPAALIQCIQNVLDNPAVKNKGVWRDERYDWENALCFESMDAWVNPIWLLVSLQRERSLFGQEGDEKDFDFAQGVVGQHAPGTRKETWNGLPAQLKLSLRTASWAMGQRPEVCFRRGSMAGKVPQHKRWTAGGVEIDLYSDTTYKPVGKHLCKTMAEYVQLVFTPTENWEKLLDLNGSIYEKWVLPFYC